MKIRKLSILGFKSFMDRFEITFPFGISGIVGPNGCGKSNIVDAIRWCLGEQSPKQLRGRKMEDIIFNGAVDYKLLGMAEVSLLFENGNGSFPPGFERETELSVTRRLYRSGESEYLVNNVSCRLKDVQEIFMDTGLGNRNYSIIGQGKIGMILEQRPEETRVMLEEAAGITKYRKKVEASRKKIELTETNLQRVEDVLGELQRQMRSLKRQASKAKRYKTICDEIQNLEIRLYSNNYNQYKGKSENTLKSTEDLVQQELVKSTSLSQLHANIETMNLEFVEKDAALNKFRERSLKLRDIVRKKEASLESLAGEMRMQKELEGRLSVEREELKKRLSDFAEEKKRLEKEKEKIKERSLGLEAEISLGDKRLGTRRGQLKSIKEDYEEARSELNAGENREIGLSHETGYLNKALSQITDNRSRLEKELREIKEKTGTVIKASKRNGLARESTVERLQEIEVSIERQKQALEELGMTCENLQLELKSSEAELNVCQSRLSSLKTLTENFEGYKMGVRTIMKAKDLAPLQQGRIMGIVADVIQVDSRYEQAVEAVLADKLQYVIVESADDGRQAVEYLRQKARGRSSFIPIKELKVNEPMTSPNFPLLLDFVSVPEKYDFPLNVLLGHVVLTETLEEAIAAWKNNGKDYSFVTVDGDLVDQRGVISGGRLTQGSRGLLARKREILELEAKSVKNRGIVDDLKFKLENIMADIQEKKGLLEVITEEKWTCQEEVNEFDKKLFRLAQELDQLERLSLKITEDLERKGIERDKHKKELSKIEEKLQQHKIRCEEERQYFLEKEFELNESEKEFERLRNELEKLKADCRIFKEERRGLIRETERLDDYVDDSLKRLERIEEDISLGRDRHDACREKREYFREEIKEFYEKLQEAEEDVNLSERKKITFQDGIKEEENKARQFQGEIDALREKINRAKMEHSEIHFKMTNIMELVMEKFNLTLGDIYGQHLDDNFSASELEGKIENEKRIRQTLGEVNLTAIKEHEALIERFEFIKTQREDLNSSIESLKAAIKKINTTSLEKFNKTIQEVDAKLKEIFPILFNGGSAALKVTDEARPLESGVLVEVQPPGKKLSHMGLLSGGEKALVAMALLFAIYMIRPSPFCLLDEVDAPLDEANIDRFNNLLKKIKLSSQVIMVTHSRRTMEITDRLFGITMEKAGVSKVVSVNVGDIHNQTVEGPSNDQHTLH